MLNGLGGKFRSFKFGGIIENCRPNPYGIVGSLESESIVTISGSGDAIDDMEIISRVSSPDVSVEVKTIGVFGLGTLWSLDACSTKNTSESREFSDKLDAIFAGFKFLKLNYLIEATGWKSEIERMISIAGNDNPLSEAAFHLMFPRRCSASMKIRSRK